MSTDGVNWETVCVDTTVTLRGITYGNDLYAAVGFSNGKDGRVYTSPDGINWSQAVETTGHQLYDITYGNNKFVAVGQGQKVVVSSDGITWLVKAAPQNSYLNSIIYTGNLYVAVGSGSSSYSKIVVSTDGENWEARGSADCDLKDVVYGNEILVAVGTDLTSKPRIYTSVDNGATWTPYYPAQGYEHTKLFTVEYDGSKFVAAGYSYIGVLYNQYVLTSTDGKVWTSGSAQADIRFKALTFGNGTLVGVGDYGDIVSSSDGVTWAKRTLGLNRGALDDVASNGSIFVAVGSNGAIQTSADGITWTAWVSGTTERLGSVEYLNGKFIAVGSGGVILTSGDGIIWSKQVVTDTINFSDVTYGNGLYMVVGQQSHTLVILKSSDGATWSRVGDSHRTLASTITYGDGTFIALGYDQVYRSDNGSYWTGTYLSGISPSDITYAEGRFIATGGNGGIYISVDKGVTWTVKEKVAGATGQINSVAYGGGNLVAVANDGKILISFDKGDTWEQQVSGYFLNGVVAGNSNFVAVGSTGLTLQSKDFGVPSDPDADAVDAAKAALTWDTIKGVNIAKDNVTGNLVNPLPTTGASETDISWSASPTGWININSGEVTRPTSAQGDKRVTLTATITKGTASATKTFDLTIKAAGLTPEEAVAAAMEALTWSDIKGKNNREDSVTLKLNLIDSGAHDTAITWSASPTGWINTNSGEVKRPAVGEDNKVVTLTATISKEGGTSKTKSFHLTILALPSGDSGSGSGGGVTTYTITATAGTGGEISPKGNIPVKKGSEKIFTITADEDYIIQDVKIDGKSIGVVETYTFKEVSKNHIIEVTFEKPDQEVEEPVTEDEEWDNPFTDVSEKDWFYETVKNVYQKELMKGTTSSKFSPELYTTRATIVTILYRLEGEPEIIGDTIFSDIPSETWYTEAVIWATNNDITKGYGSGEFGAGDSTTREQLAALLYRYSEYKGFDISAASDLSAFTDADEVSEWAETAVKWAVGSGIITGKPGNVLDPKGTATRAEIAAMLTRFIQKYNLL